MSNELSHLQIAQLNRIENILKGMNCAYAIRTPDGQIVGDVTAVQGKKSNSGRAPLTYPRGEIRGYIRPFMEHIKAGQVACVPYDKYPASMLQSSVASLASDMWGRGTYTTAMNNELKQLEVLRTDGI